ncbi:MAG TPA: flagellar export chaperone FliS [Rubrivivax sp.]|nr:flagellar export chaperone FliS [Rubrivivax sp.]
MFSSATPGHFGRLQSPNLYRRMAAETGVADAGPHRLVTMLFDGFIDALAEARGAMRERDIERKGRVINRAVRIVEEGLRAGLDLRAGGVLAADLDRLYRYIGLRLVQANLRNDEAILDECQGLVQPLRDAWEAIAPSHARKPA